VLLNLKLIFEIEYFNLFKFWAINISYHLLRAAHSNSKPVGNA
jgi:hypothetical protein